MSDTSARLDAHQDRGCPLTRAAYPGLRLKKEDMHDACSPSHHCAHLASTRAASWRLPWSCNPLVTCLFAAPCKCNPPYSNGSCSVWADRCSASDIASLHADRRCECFRLHDCICRPFTSMHVCNAGAARQAKWRARDAMWPAYHAVLARKPWLVDPPLSTQQTRAQVSEHYMLY